MFEGKLTIDVSDRFGALIAGLTGAIEGIKGSTPVNTDAPCVTPAPAPTIPTAAPTAPTAAPTAPTAAPLAPTAAPAYTLEQVGKAGADLIAANAAKLPDLQKLLADFGVPYVTALKPEQLGAFATALRGLGANI